MGIEWIDWVLPIILTLLGGGFVGAIVTGLSVKSVVQKNNTDALKIYQEIAAIAAKSELDAQIRDRENTRKANAVIDRLEYQLRIAMEQNMKLKDVISAWTVGVDVLHRQIKNLKHDPHWRPNPEDVLFLDNIGNDSLERGVQ